MGQRYAPGVAHDRMSVGGCPECAATPESHNPDPRFWVPRHCDLRPDGVHDRIAQYEADKPHAPCADPDCRQHGIAASNARQSKFYAANPRTDATS